PSPNDLAAFGGATRAEDSLNDLCWWKPCEGQSLIEQHRLEVGGDGCRSVPGPVGGQSGVVRLVSGGEQLSELLSLCLMDKRQRRHEVLCDLVLQGGDTREEGGVVESERRGDCLLHVAQPSLVG